MIFVHTLGTASIDAGETRITPSSTRKFALLLHLTAEVGRRVSRTTLQDLVFPDQTERNAKHSLRELVYQYRQAGVRVASDPHGIELVSEGVRRDYTDVIAGDRLDAAQVMAAQGGFLPGYAPEHSEAYTEWLGGYRARSTFELCGALLREVARAREVGDWGMTERAARACLALDPLNEEATLALAEMLAIGGAKAQAVKLLDNYLLEVGRGSRDIRVPAAILRRRIGERVPDAYWARPELPFVGRDAEMQRLRRLLEIARGGESVCAVVAGEPGIGKTRLVSQFTALAAVEGAHVLRVALQPADVRRPMGVFLDLVPMLLQLPGALGCSPESMATLSRITRRKVEDEPSLEGREPEFISNAITASIGDLLDAISSESAVVVVIEDAHWIDEHSMRATLDLVTPRNPRRLMTVATTRDGSRWVQEGRHVDPLVTIIVERLPSQASRELSQIALRGSPGERDSALQDWVADTAGGNPLFVVSLAAHYHTTHVAFEVPSGLRELLGCRLDSLTRKSIAVLQTCVALGRRSDVNRLRTCLDMPHVDLLTSIAELDAAHSISILQDHVIPAHPLLAEVLLEKSSLLTQKVTHYRIAEVLQTEAGMSGDSLLAWDCAEHWVIAGEDERAFDAFRVCADQAIAMGQATAAAEILLRAANLNVPADVRLRTLRDMIRTAISGGECELVLQGANAARKLAATWDHDEIELAELRALGSTQRDSTDFEERALRCVLATGAPAAHRVSAALLLLKYADAFGKADIAAVLAGAISSDDLSTVDATVQLEYQMIYHIAYGEPGQAIEAALALRRLSEAMPPAQAASLLFNIGVLFWRIGRLNESLEVSTQAHALADQCGAFRLSAISALQLAQVQYDRGEKLASADWRAKERELAARHPHISDGYEGRTVQIEMALVEGDGARAAALLSVAELDGLFSTESRQRWQRAFAMRIRQIAQAGSLSESDMASLLGDHNVTQLTGIDDLEIAIAALELAAHKKEGEARELLAAYTNHRRRIGPVTPPLRQAIVQTGFASFIAVRRDTL